jgi:hypothetical protein
MPKRHWIISGWRSTKKLVEFRIPYGTIGEKQVIQLLRALAAKYSLTDSEIVSCYVKTNSRLYMNVLEVQCSRSSELSCGINPYFTARIVETMK